MNRVATRLQRLRARHNIQTGNSGRDLDERRLKRRDSRSNEIMRTVKSLRHRNVLTTNGLLGETIQKTGRAR